MAKIRANLLAGKVFSNSLEAINLFSSKDFGEKDNQKVFYSLPESFFLIETKKMELFSHQNKKLSIEEIQRKFQRLDKNFFNKYLIFKDLRKSGYVVKTALKFGAEFRVYEKKSSVKNNHSKWILFPASENENFTWQDFSAKNRVAHSAKKNILIAIVDSEHSISYYEVKWAKP